MAYARGVALAIVTTAVLVAGALADRIVLKSGQEITAGVLKQDSKSVVVDLGGTVVSLPRADVASVTADTTTRPTSRPTTGPTTNPSAVEKNAPGWQLYRVADLTPTSIDKNAETYGEAVVMVNSPGGQGSGFIINPDGYLITNYHVIAQETRLKVTVFRKTAQGYEQKHYKQVKIVAMNPFVDLAMLKMNAPDTVFKYCYIGQMSDLSAGQDCFAIGNPLGLTRTVSQGIISTTNRNFEGQLYIQTTADINPGNSGGPLFNAKGEVIGVTSMGYLFMSGLNFAIPCDVVKRFIENRDAFAFDEDNPNSGCRYLQPAGRVDKSAPPVAKLPSLDEPAKN